MNFEFPDLERTMVYSGSNLKISKTVYGKHCTGMGRISDRFKFGKRDLSYFSPRQLGGAKGLPSPRDLVIEVRVWMKEVIKPL